MRIFMTGATGFVGLNIVDALLSAGHEPVCFLRPGARKQFLEKMPVTLVTGELSDQATLTNAMRGADIVIHTAGNTSANRADIDVLREANVASTRAILDASLHCGVKRIIYTSTTSTIGSLESATQAANETVPLTGWRSRSPYAQTKLEAESLLIAASKEIECILLNPAEVIGAYDHTLQWGRMVLAVCMDQLPFIPPGSGTFCPARSVAQAHVAAITHGRSGQRYILGGHNISFADFIAKIALILNIPLNPHDVRPYTLQRREVRMRERLNQAVAVDAYRMRVFGSHHLFDDSLAKTELGYQSESLEIAIEACFHWYQANGFLPNQ